MDKIRVFKLNLILLVALAFFINGCASFKQNMMVKTAKMMRGFGKKAVNRYPDVEQLRQAMPVMIVQSDMFLEMAPDDPELLLAAAELNGGYAMFLRKTDKERAVKYYKKSRDYSLRILKQNPVFNEALDKSDDEYIKALQTLSKEDVPALFTLLTSTFGWIGTAQTDKPRALAELGKVEGIIERILVLDDTFKYGGVHAINGTYNAARPAMFGGDQKKARYHFEQAFKISERKFLLWLFLYAKHYAVRVQDRELFVKTLEEIIAAPDNLLPEQNLANEIAKQQAKDLLEETDDMF